MTRQLVFVGTYSEPILFGTGQLLQGQGRGIHAFWFEDGRLTPAAVTEARNPSFLCFDPGRRFLYCVNEFKEFEGEASGGVSAYRIDPATGALAFLNMRASRGTDPCHIIADATGRFVLVSNFRTGSVLVLPIREDGSLGEASAWKQHEGSSVDPVRQAGPHAHAVCLSPDNRFALVPDLGLDGVVTYRFDAERGTLTPNAAQPFVATAPGAGPRQLVFHPGGRFAYLINELDSTMTAFSYAPQDGALTPLHTLPTLPPDATGRSTCAEVHVSPSGRFLYGSNRGHDSLAVYALDPGTGRMTAKDHQGTGGRIPRHFEPSPDGRWLIAANQDTDNLVVFRLDPDTGRPEPTGETATAGTPVCVRFL